MPGEPGRQAEGGGGWGARGGGASQRRPAPRQPSERGNCARDTHVPAGGGWGGREGGRAGGREEPEGGTDGRDGGRAGWGRARGRDEASWWKQRPSTPGPPRSPARQGEPCQGPARPLLPLPARWPPGDGENLAPAELTSRAQCPPRGASRGPQLRPGCPTPCLIEKQKQNHYIPGGLRMMAISGPLSFSRLPALAPAPRSRLLLSACRAADLREGGPSGWVRPGDARRIQFGDDMPDTAESQAKCLVHLARLEIFGDFLRRSSLGLRMTEARRIQMRGRIGGRGVGAAGANVPRVRVLQKNSCPLLSRARLLCLRYLFEPQPILPPPYPVL